MGRCGLLAYRCEFQTGTEHLSAGWTTVSGTRIRRRRTGRSFRRRQSRERRPSPMDYAFIRSSLLLIIGAFLGDLVETIFCRVTAGVWMSRSSFVWGPFSIVWGVALAAATMLLYRYRNYSDRFLFFMGTFLGGAYEYTCSVLTELCLWKGVLGLQQDPL